MSAVAPLPLVARFACGLVLVNCPPQALAESNERTPVGQLEGDLASLSIGGGEGVGLARSVDDLDVTHNASENAPTEIGFPRVGALGTSATARTAPDEASPLP
jgi:hypothetical protein